MLPHPRKDFSWTWFTEVDTSWSFCTELVTIVQLLDVPEHNLLHALFILFMISLDHPCEIENGVLKYIHFFYWEIMPTTAVFHLMKTYCCFTGLLLIPMLLCVGGHNNIFLFMLEIFMVHMSVSERWVTQQLNYWCSTSYFVIICSSP